MEGFLALLVHSLVCLLGAAVGSFLNVVVYRLPAGVSLVYPPSRCPYCLHPLAARDNIPVFGWMFLKGRCRYCQSPIARRYPLVEAITALMFWLIFWVCGFSWHTVGYWLLASWLLALSLIDLDTLTLPDSLTQSGLLLGFLFQGWLGFVHSGTLLGSVTQLMVGVMGAVVGIWLLEIISLVGTIALGQTAMGAGDAKLAAMMGAWLGWQYLLLAGFLASAIGAGVGGGAIALGWLNRRQPMPFGPFLAIGTLMTALWGSAIAQAYTRIFFPVV